MNALRGLYARVRSSGSRDPQAEAAEDFGFNFCEYSMARLVVGRVAWPQDHRQARQFVSSPSPERARRQGRWSAGRAHSALCIAGRAAKQVKEASKLQQFANSVEQDVCRITFSLLARGKNSAASRNVCPVGNQ